MKQIIAYCRVSSVTDRQSTDTQEQYIKDYATMHGYEIIEIFREKISGAKTRAERPVLDACIEKAKETAATIVVYDITRWGRNVWDVLDNVNYCVKNKINVIFINNNARLFDDNGNVDLITPILISALGMAAEVEKENIKNRLGIAREIAQNNGVKMGRKKGSVKTEETKIEQYGEVIKLLKKGLSVADIADICKGKGIKCSQSTIKRLKKEFNL